MKTLTLPSGLHKTGKWAGRVVLRVRLNAPKGRVIVVSRFPSQEWLSATVEDSTYLPFYKGKPCGDGFVKGESVYVKPECGCMRLDASDGIDVGENEQIWIVGVTEDPADILARVA